jgi:tRNA threonylcarbamoyl adenosine modification protein (Sua5/YciO/YrdC/YwlC family)
LTQRFEVHSQNPQPRLLKQAAAILHAGGVIALPTDSSDAPVCRLDDKAAAEALRSIRPVDEPHQLTLLCRDLSDLARLARVDNRKYRLLKLGTPGPFTFILEATKEVPRRLSHPSRRTIGLWVPEHPVAQELLAFFGEPLLATMAIQPGDCDALTDADEIAEPSGQQLQAVVDAAPCPRQPTTVVELRGHEPVLMRQGRGDPAQLGLAP